MLEFLMWWWGLGLIGAVFLVYQDWKNGCDLSFAEIPLIGFYLFFCGALLLVGSIFTWDGWGKTILRGRKQKEN